MQALGWEPLSFWASNKKFFQMEYKQTETDSSKFPGRTSTPVYIFKIKFLPTFDVIAETMG